ncbi:hypothetical protein PR202_gb15863 [Eleusine coracana subsp. coracana]|uniref:Uncharacterized protein n=1 Tax=Eleusine coracana subsp. coracana TaxID=191504 RepID=A0AAV5F0M2_ELECO|nr:hypothetical protein PR202_gb15863 [Eleusine coracana subsp. coracana]
MVVKKPEESVERSKKRLQHHNHHGGVADMETSKCMCVRRRQPMYKQDATRVQR